ncbi:DNA-(apurinic or apyrimidinic site) lyase [Handroanthus impetiginosus]|uniref:DNA-(Apurinic or apyrimidinic site) lyase n=1 Tax=Handroanthus impetiginosus TaxID=429701 RepID=A0A2G9GLC7_9LAMI|nr:DNA-(apurinic or apyrimidinic site) lyase [Handroanthus impetiginosus]
MIPVPQLSIDANSSQEKFMQDNVVLSPQPEILGRQHNEISPNTLDKSSAAISTSPNGKDNSDGENGGIDLNKTPQQKAPKRRKHRPKVIVEGKPKRTPKPAVAQSKTPDGNPTPKRKYTRRKGVKPPTTPSADVVDVVEGFDAGPAARSCKRKLNFDLDNGAENGIQARGFDYQGEKNGGSVLPFNLNLDSHNAELSAVLSGPLTSATKEVTQTTYGKEMQQAQTAYNFVHSINRTPAQNSAPPPTTAPPSKNHALNVIARSLIVRNASINQITDDNRYNQVHQRFSGGLSHLVIQANTSNPNLDGRRQSVVQTMPQLLEDTVDVTEQEGSKRKYTHTGMRHPHTITLMGSQLWSRGVAEQGQCSRDSSCSWQHGLDTGNKTNLEDKLHGTSSSKSSGITSIEDFLAQIESRRNKSFPGQSSTIHQNGGLTNSDSRGRAISRNPSDHSNEVIRDWYMNNPLFRNKFQQQHASSQVHLGAARMAPKTSHDYGNEQNTNSVIAVTNWHLESASRGDPKSFPIRELDNSPDRVAVERRTAGQTSSKKVLIVDKVLQQDSKKSRSYGHSSKKVTGSQEEKRNLFSIENITDLLRDMHINDNGKEIVQEEQGALVPYRGDGTIVPYDVKKRRPRPRVDLDPETNRVWNLLMSKEGGESAETMDSDKQKWWEEERKVFRGRVNSFIARMHKVQGDRRFSKWKGSVVDSVIGVFLTQNVSDHLSSSAFMSLAAKFPLKSTSIRQSSCENEGSSSVEHHKVHITYPDGTTDDHKIIKEPAYNHSSVTSTESSECKAENAMSETKTFLTNDHTRRTEEEIISSQSSSESFVFQASEDIRSSSGSNSEADDGWNFSKNHGYLSVSDQAERSAQHQFPFMGRSFPNSTPLIGHENLKNPAFRQNPGVASRNMHSDPFISQVQYHQSPVLPSANSWPNMSMGLERWEADILAFPGKESMSSLASTEFANTNGTGVERTHDNTGQSAESTLTVQNGRPKFQPSPTDHSISNKHLKQQADLPDRSQNIINGQHIIKPRQGKQETFQKESTSLTDPIRPAGAFSKQPIDNWTNGDIQLEPTAMGDIHASGETSSKMSTTSNARKRKAGKEKAEPINWDTLRKGVESKAGTGGKSKEAMDSLDYETLRNADVREISDTIKERGMNNMLAERIKDFLNRLVRDHGSIDLEWLRDVQPDKAKDYLLSIRGLGLKSVECVRLLTLHHLAFPVDTNVGRIAVRLGWVPLQPLPESLQLHLLELYPVLESIQKYLWPRLCKLDQQTMYELHYQMITFGKVFCTKREPNCNACPLRAECRHFASAFASARLALPGPEERRIVSSAAPISANINSDVIIKPMPLPPSENNMENGTGLTRNWEPTLPPSENNMENGTGLTRNWEPLIEEPTTPESPTEVSERDIEDAFYDDPNEIPVITLNIKEFTTNLQSFMQENMEMAEGDMSKALVALSPELASIPVPKLKNISRLRTEHQVYELPDSHPLLKGMDRREPDDPSPYLLAIWTPGETADSVQPPESKCSSQEGGGLCNNNTCFSCNSIREAQAQTVRGTILIPCRTAMRGSFPLNGTYFQVNEVFADDESSLNPIDVPRSLIWNLPRKTVFFGTSVSTIFKGLSTDDIQFCFWRGFVCVRGFDQKTRAPRPLKARLHLPASKMAKQNE